MDQRKTDFEQLVDSMLTPTTSVPLPIEFLEPNSSGTVVELCGNPSQVQRLEELGICPGTCVRMLTQGKPCLVSVNGKRFCLRLGETADIYIVPSNS